MLNRLLLNHGLTEMHRGRLAEARRAFSEVCNSDQEDQAIRLIARGYLGSCHHLEGKLETAKEYYEAALTGLLVVHRLRAASIVEKNLGDLHWHQQRDIKEPWLVKEAYEASVRLAESAGSVDLVHLHRTALTRVLRRDTSRVDDRREALRFLASAE